MKTLRVCGWIAWKVLKIMLKIAWWLVKWSAIIAAFAVVVFLWLVFTLPCVVMEIADRVAWKQIEHREEQMRQIFGRGSGIRIKYRDY